MPLGGIVSSGYGKGGGGGSGDGIEYVENLPAAVDAVLRYHLRSTKETGLCGPAKIQRLYDARALLLMLRIYGLLSHLQLSWLCLMR